MTTGTLALFVVYGNPRDYPRKFVLRRWLVSRAGARAEPEPVAVADSLDQVRAAVPDGLVRTEPHPTDDRAILEVWV